MYLRSLLHEPLRQDTTISRHSYENMPLCSHKSHNFRWSGTFGHENNMPPVVWPRLNEWRYSTKTRPTLSEQKHTSPSSCCPFSVYAWAFRQWRLHTTPWAEHTPWSPSPWSTGLSHQRSRLTTFYVHIWNSWQISDWEQMLYMAVGTPFPCVWQEIGNRGKNENSFCLCCLTM